MPSISRFYGIIIKMFFSDHNPPHFHAQYGEYIALIDLKTFDVIEGDLPAKALKLVREWAQNYSKELMEMWESKQLKKLPPLE